MSEQKKTVKVRFPPSPTGMVHIGNIRTALYNWLYARHLGGKMVLRIEDTDRARSKPEYTQAILDALKWLNIDFDEGPFFQSERAEIHKKAVKKLIEEGKAYRCYCTPEEVNAMREQARKEGRKPMYNGKCRDVDPAEWRDDKPFVIRFRSPADDGETSWDDLVRGNVSIKNSEIDDLIIMRSDGSPTYNFVVVIDDAEMGITHVIRGEDHITNTPRQIQLYNALGYEPPVFAHLPLILNKQRRPYSKRDGMAGVEDFKLNGFLPDALINYIARLGWGHGDEEIFSRKELIEYFDVADVSKGGAVFDFEKLLWLNGQYMIKTENAELAPVLIEKLKERDINAEGDARLPKIIESLKERTKTLNEMCDMAMMFFDAPITLDEKAAKKFLKAPAIEMLSDMKNLFSDLQNFTHDPLKELLEKYMEEKEIKMRKLAQPLRVALTGGVISPGIYETIELIGKERTLNRVTNAMEYYESNLKE